MADNELKNLVIMFFGSFCIGWWSKVTALLTDPIVSMTYQALYRLGWIGVLVVIALWLRQMYEDYMSYVAIGVFAVPAIVTFLLPWDSATILMAFSAAILTVLGVDVARKYFKL